MPKVSILVPAYNAEKFLPDCLNSIESQTFRDFEAVFVDDGSTDGTGELLDAFARAHGYARVMHQKNSGIGMTRHVLMREATGDFLVFLDSDDMLAPDCLEKAVAKQAETDADIVGFRYVSVNEKGEPTQKHHADRQYAEYDSASKVYGSLFTRETTLYMWDKLYRREFARDIPLPTARCFEDAYYNQFLLGRAKKMVVMPDRLYFYRQNRQSIMHTLTLEKLEDWLKVSEFTYAYTTEHFPEHTKRADSYRNLIRLRCFDMIFMAKPFTKHSAWKIYYRRLWKWILPILRTDTSMVHNLRKLYALTILFCPPLAAFMARKKLGKRTRARTSVKTCDFAGGCIVQTERRCFAGERPCTAQIRSSKILSIDS